MAVAGAGAQIMAKVGAGNKQFRLRNTAKNAVFFEFKKGQIKVKLVLWSRPETIFFAGAAEKAPSCCSVTKGFCGGPSVVEPVQL